jgi:hypothetical protein
MPTRGLGNQRLPVLPVGTPTQLPVRPQPQVEDCRPPATRQQGRQAGRTRSSQGAHATLPHPHCSCSVACLRSWTALAGIWPGLLLCASESFVTTIISKRTAAMHSRDEASGAGNGAVGPGRQGALLSLPGGPIAMRRVTIVAVWVCVVRAPRLGARLRALNVKPRHCCALPA